MVLGRTEYHELWLTPFGSKKNGCLVLAASSLEVREQAHIIPRPSCLEGHGDQGWSAMTEDGQMIYTSSKRDKKQAREMQSGQIQFGPWESYRVSPFEADFWECGREEGYWKQPACVYQG